MRKHNWKRQDADPDDVDEAEVAIGGFVVSGYVAMDVFECRETLRYH